MVLHQSLRNHFLDPSRRLQAEAALGLVRPARQRRVQEDALGLRTLGRLVHPAVDVHSNLVQSPCVLFNVKLL